MSLKKALIRWIAIPLGSLLVRGYARTLRIRVEGEDHVREHLAQRGGVIFASWHQRFYAGSLERDVDFVSMAPVVLDEIVQERNWFEMEVLRSYHSLFGSALNAVRDVGYLIALNTHGLHAEAARFRT